MPTVLEAIAESNTLAQLLARMESSKHCFEIVMQRLPLGLHTSIAAGPIDENIWCLLVNNASALAKLKQLIPALLLAIQAKGIPIKDIKLKRSY
jgi:hypothetical protein